MGFLVVPMFSQRLVVQHLTLSSLFDYFHSGCFAAITSPMADAWPSLIALADTFAAVVVGLLSNRCFATEYVMVIPLCECFAIVGVFASPSVESLVDALPPLTLLVPSLVHDVESMLALFLRMFLPAWSSLADALSPLLLVLGWILSHQSIG